MCFHKIKFWWIWRFWIVYNVWCVNKIWIWDNLRCLVVFLDNVWYLFYLYKQVPSAGQDGGWAWRDSHQPPRVPGVSLQWAVLLQGSVCRDSSAISIRDSCQDSQVSYTRVPSELEIAAKHSSELDSSAISIRQLPRPSSELELSTISIRDICQNHQVS